MFSIRIVYVFVSLIAVASETHHSGGIGREDAIQGELPYHVAIPFAGQHICNGALVVINGQQLFLTTAQCVLGSENIYAVLAGDVIRMGQSGLEQSRQVSRSQRHTNYDGMKFNNDIAVVWTSSPFEINDNVAPIPLPARRQDGTVVISGWARNEILQKIEGNVVDVETYQSDYGSDSRLPPSIICSSYNNSNGGNPDCLLESCCPLRAVDGDDLAGIYSWGFACGRSQYPDVYMEVSYFIKWINSLVV